MSYTWGQPWPLVVMAPFPKARSAYRTFSGQFVPKDGLDGLDGLDRLDGLEPISKMR